MVWRCDGRPLSGDELAALGQSDGEVLCDYADAVFRFSAETVAPRSPRGALPGEETVVMTLRRLDRTGWLPAACLVDFSRPSRLAGEAGDALLDGAAATASGAARRCVAAGLFRRAEEMVNLTHPSAAGARRSA